MFKDYKLKYITHGWDEDGPKMYGVLMIKSDHGWVVEVWLCDTNGAQVSDPIEWNDGLTWWSALRLFYRKCDEYDRYVNYRQ